MSPKVVLITGCSSGIGKDLAARLSQNEYTVVATARNLATVTNLPTALKLSLDVTDNQSISTAVHEVIERFGRIDVLINNAGYAVRSTVEEVPETQIQQMFDVNVFGVIRMVRAVVPFMRKAGSGQIINISSMAGKMVLPISGPYCASKFALEALSDALRLELAAFGISVVIVEPGNIHSHFMKTVQTNSEKIIANPQSPYSELYKNYHLFNDKSRLKEPGPEAVSTIIQKTLESPKPKARYRAAVPLMNLFLSCLNDRIKDRIVKSAFKINSLG
ncbi:MAG TPA: oxidoreductase [Firmicutes bacterium]|jgi:NADP-dependent 3-hydroxy acid dehydrogenase YdfG|nr:oxidoreductase [Bacillota bacterium]